MEKVIRHGPAVVLGLFLIMMGVQKFGAENIIFETIAQKSGISLFEPVIRTFTGVSEVIAAALLFLPKTRLFGALGAVGLIGGAIVFHLSPWLGIYVSMAPGEPATPMLFSMAVGSFLLAVFVLIQKFKTMAPA